MKLKIITIELNQYGPKRAKLCPKGVSTNATPKIPHGNPVNIKERNNSAKDNNAPSFNKDLNLYL
jgi:hypothetical protein